jgi:hypothetical protein
VRPPPPPSARPVADRTDAARQIAHDRLERVVVIIVVIIIVVLTALGSNRPRRSRGVGGGVGGVDFGGFGGFGVRVRRRSRGDVLGGRILLARFTATTWSAP